MPKSSPLDRLRHSLHRLTLQQAKQLYAELGTLIQDLEQQASTSPTPAESSRRDVVDTRHIGDYLYQLERVRCGKAGCKCAGADGELHGPYWYAYWREDGRQKSRYIGKRFRLLS
ncbi:DUF6788 family protein [Pantanalinema rosaneae CENA516]|uniref:DUF6788 family protein n=1 Tax=Pantanalinema rosaneae TaxID=1620701 RepID=UPI003D6E595D